MSISIVQAPRASTPYPWAKFARWANEQGLSPDEFQTLLENGAEPTITHAAGFALDESVQYPGLPSLDGQTIDDLEPVMSINPVISGGEST